MITTKTCKDVKNEFDGVQVQVGHAYRLVKDYTGNSTCIGNIYIASHLVLTNIETGFNRNRNEHDRYVEVDLEILVKEKN